MYRRGWSGLQCTSALVCNVTRRSPIATHTREGGGEGLRERSTTPAVKGHQQWGWSKCSGWGGGATVRVGCGPDGKGKGWEGMSREVMVAAISAGGEGGREKKGLL